MTLEISYEALAGIGTACTVIITLAIYTLTRARREAAHRAASDEQLTAIRNSVATGFSHIESRMDDMRGRLDSGGDRMKAMDNTLSDIRERVGRVEGYIQRSSESRTP